MKYIQLMIIAQMLFQQWVFAQPTDLRVEYRIRFNDNFDRGRKDRYHKGYLFVSNELTMFYMRADEEYKAADDRDESFEPDTNMLVYTDQTKSLMVAREYGFDGKPFFISDSLYPMQWQLGNDNRLIDSIQCTRATCLFRGRNYEAWFAPDIPIAAGPWKMGGLPGLIIEMKDEQENMFVKLLGIRKEFTKISLPQKVDYTMADHIGKFKKLIERLSGSALTAGSGDCISCQTASQYEIYTWEKIPLK